MLKSLNLNWWILGLQPTATSAINSLLHNKYNNDTDAIGNDKLKIIIFQKKEKKGWGPHTILSSQKELIWSLVSSRGIFTSLTGRWQAIHLEGFLFSSAKDSGAANWEDIKI